MQKTELRSQKACAFTLTKKGKRLLKDISERICDRTGKIDCYTLSKFEDQNFKAIESTKEFFRMAFKEYDTIIAVISTGIVVRSISDLLVHKSVDPGILVLDQNGDFIISLLSGHLGHANENARILSQVIGAQPVITTASDCQRIMAVDTFADRLNRRIKDFESAKEVTSILINGGKVGIIGFNEYSLLPSGNCYFINYNELELENSINLKDYEALIVDARLKLAIRPSLPVVYLYQKQVVVGVGMRKDIPVKILKREIINYLESNRISIDEIACFATIELKRNEYALNQLSEMWGIDVKIVSDEKVKSVQDKFDGSDFVERITGMRAVADPCGYIVSGYGSPIAPVSRSNGVTLSLWLISNE